MELKLFGITILLFMFFGILHVLIQSTLFPATSMPTSISKRAQRIERYYVLVALFLMLITFVFWVVSGFLGMY